MRIGEDRPRMARNGVFQRGAQLPGDPASQATTLASRASSRLNGSMLLEPTVAQRPSTTATLACRKLAVYSWISTPSRSSM